MERRKFLRLFGMLPLSGTAIATAAVAATKGEDIRAGMPEDLPPPPTYSYQTSHGTQQYFNFTPGHEFTGTGTVTCAPQSITLKLSDHKDRSVGLKPGKDGHLWVYINGDWRRVVTE